MSARSMACCGCAPGYSKILVVVLLFSWLIYGGFAFPCLLIPKSSSDGITHSLPPLQISIQKSEIKYVPRQAQTLTSKLRLVIIILKTLCVYFSLFLFKEIDRRLEKKLKITQKER